MNNDQRAAWLLRRSIAIESEFVPFSKSRNKDSKDDKGRTRLSRPIGHALRSGSRCATALEMHSSVPSARSIRTIENRRRLMSGPHTYNRVTAYPVLGRPVHNAVNHDGKKNRVNTLRFVAKDTLETVVDAAGGWARVRPRLSFTARCGCTPPCTRWQKAPAGEGPLAGEATTRRAPRSKTPSLRRASSSRRTSGVPARLQWYAPSLLSARSSMSKARSFRESVIPRR